MNYYDIKAVNASAIKAHIKGAPNYSAISTALDFGTEIHSRLLEGVKLKEISGVHTMIESLKNRGLHYFGITNEWAVEQEKYFYWPQTQIKCKAKADMISKIDPTLIADIKTCSVMPKDLKQTCEEFGYDYQAGFYLVAFQAQRFRFIFLEKKKPHSMRVCTYTRKELAPQIKHINEIIQEVWEGLV